MEKLSDDEVGQIMRRVRSRSDRRACAQVCSQWHRVEGLTRNSLRILDPQLMHQFLPHFRNLLSIEAQMEVCDRDLECMAENCRSLQVLNLYLSKWRRVMDLEFLSTYQDFKPLGDDGVVAIANNCKDLQHVSLRWRQGIGDIAVSALARSCSLLVYLDLGHCKRITDRSLEALSALQVLNLAECGPNVTDVGGTGIAGVTTLQSLNLAWLINVSDVSIITIAHHCVDMEELNLSGCELVTGTGLRAFAGHKKLRALTLSSCSNIHSDDVDATASSCLALHYLCLDRGLRPWMPEECLERLQSRKIEIEWL
ncbi:hypothetical protein AXG93_1962s1440 [Marchantia polymorpha subsp. ruderalis]|uniref:Uncharacterized protein n=1 Tax=Marchantia polymorpha subsp. ruderalis TaxID=1480154 RepID=A0A176WDU2_MARPO|nr:hypothetical protein AXG93_1962s1440 [Marchantia polymorpha subsp. ruderalis]